MPTNPKDQLSKKLIWSPAMAVLYLVNDQLQSDYSLHHSLLYSHSVPSHSLPLDLRASHRIQHFYA